MKLPFPRLTVISLGTAAFVTTGCKDNSANLEEKISQLEKAAADADARQQSLERDLLDQQIARERDAIERERQQIDDERARLAEIADEESAARRQELAEREEALRLRETGIGERETRLVEMSGNIESLSDSLSERERELAGREALPRFESNVNQNIVNQPVADYSTFYNSLSSYGSWFETPNYGYVYQPAVVHRPGWRPYVHGRWACTDQGWTWISDEPFGWATYHYGRWAQAHGRGWVWIPGDTWAPSWVCWREGGDYIGWAPLPPETIGWRSNDWNRSVDFGIGLGASYFSFVSTSNFGYPVHRYHVPYSRNTTIFSNTVNITNIYVRDSNVFIGGPRYDRVHRASKGNVPFYRLARDWSRRPGRDATGMRAHVSNGSLHVPGPSMRADWNEALRPGRVRDSLGRLEIERERPLDPRIENEFAANRERNRRTAREAVENMGGEQEFDRRRVNQLDQNLQLAKVAVERREREGARQDRGTGTPGNLAANRRSGEEEPSRERPQRRPGSPGTGEVDQPLAQQPNAGEQAQADEQTRQREAINPGLAVGENRDRRADRGDRTAADNLAQQRQQAEEEARSAEARQEEAARQQAEQRQAAIDENRPARGNSERNPTRDDRGSADTEAAARERAEQQAAAERDQMARGERQARDQADARNEQAEARRQQMERGQRDTNDAARQRDQRSALEETENRRRAADQSRREALARGQREADAAASERARAAATEREQSERETRLAQQEMREQEAREAAAANEAQAAARQQAAAREQAAQREQMEGARRQQTERAERENAERARVQRDQATRQQQEAARQQQQDAMRQQQERATRQQQEQAQRQQQQEATRRQQQEQARRQQQEAAQRQQQEAMRRQQEQAQRQQQERAARQQQEQAQRQQQERAARQQQEQAQRQQQERAARQQQEQAQRQQQERAARQQQEQAQRQQQQQQQQQMRRQQEDAARRQQQDQAARQQQQDQMRRQQEESQRRQQPERPQRPGR